jgi:hypothetical protein
MKHAVITMVCILYLLLAACTPASEETGATDPAENVAAPEEREVPAGGPALASATPAPGGENQEEENMTMPTETEAATGEETAEPDREVVEPVTVDLRELTPAPTVVTTPREMPRPGGIDPVLELTHAMSQDLARRLGIDISEITVVNVEEVTWPDASLGCPEPGFGYGQVLTPGFLVILAAGGQEYPYHAASSRNFVLCGDNGAPVPTPAP